MKQINQKTHVISKISLIFSISAFFLYFVYLGSESDSLGVFSLFWTISSLIFGIIFLSRIKHTEKKGRGYFVIAVITSAVLLFFTVVFDIVAVIEEGAKANSQKTSEQTAEIDTLRNKLVELENKKSVVTASTPNEPSLSSIVAEWTPRVGFILCKWSASNTIASGSFVLNKTESGNVALTNRHVLLDDLGNGPDACILSVNNEEYFIPWAYDVYVVNKKGYEDFGFVKTNIPSDVIRVCNEYRFSEPRIGDKVVILGYPGIGSKESITATEGIISGIESDYYVTSAKIEHGNSGGAAVLVKNNCYLGIPSYIEVGSAEALGRILKAGFVMLPR